MKQIPLTQGKVATVDDVDYPSLSRYKWCAVFANTKGQGVPQWYAVRTHGKRPNRNLVGMHRDVCGLIIGDGKRVDHRDRNGLNNQRSNLRVCSLRQNNANMELPRHNTSGLKGVCWHKKHRRWRAAVYINNKSNHLGEFITKEEAGKAYDAAAIITFGEFALTNKIMGLL